MANTRKGSARYEGLGKDGQGYVSTESGALSNQPYGFSTRFEEGRGTNPEELVGAAHASCYAMALSFALAGKGYNEGVLETEAAVTLEKDGDGFAVTRSALTLKARVPGIAEEEFAAIAEDAKNNCPLSKLLKAEITLEHTLEG